jgi:hypothetical protein
VGLIESLEGAGLFVGANEEEIPVGMGVLAAGTPADGDRHAVRNKMPANTKLLEAFITK